MNLKKCLTLFLVLLFSKSFSQKNITINIAPSFSYRGILLELTNYNVRRHYHGYSGEFWKQFDTRSIGIDFHTKILNNHLVINLSSYFRYGHLYFDKTLQKEVKSAKGDLFADFLYSTKKRKEKNFCFLAGAGMGRVNIGTAFRYAFIPSVDSTGNPYLKEASGSFAFSTLRFVTGFEKGRWQCSLSVIASPDLDKQPYASLSLEPKISYRICSFKIPLKTRSN